VARWLAKSEPGVYAYADLARDGATEWDGVHNALALRHLKQMAPGDELMFYHSGDERAVVGIARVATAPHPDPSDDRGSWSVRVHPDRALRGPVPLSILRGDRALDGFVLFRMSRLSVLPVTDAQWTAILAHEPPSGDGPLTAARAGRAPASVSQPRGSAGRRRRSRASPRAGASRARARGSPRGTGR
jgi:predicted RNA-binding protein with PUA-like domain